VLAADSRRLASMKRDLRHLYGAQRDALQAEVAQTLHTIARLWQS